MKLGNWLVVGVVFSVASLASGLASADYVCSAYHVPAGSVFGTEGLVVADVYSAANCGGSFLGSRYFCSAGATSALCASAANYKYEGFELVALIAGLQRAAIADESVTVTAATCIGGGSGCSAYVVYRSN